MKIIFISLIAIVCAVFFSSFTTEDESSNGSLKPVSYVCPFPNTKISIACVQGYTYCTPYHCH